MLKRMRLDWRNGYSTTRCESGVTLRDRRKGQDNGPRLIVRKKKGKKEWRFVGWEK